MLEGFEFLDPADFQNREKVFNNFNNLNLPLLMFQSKRKESSTFKSREHFIKWRKRDKIKIKVISLLISNWFRPEGSKKLEYIYIIICFFCIETSVIDVLGHWTGHLEWAIKRLKNNLLIVMPRLCHRGLGNNITLSWTETLSGNKLHKWLGRFLENFSGGF